MGEMRAVFEVGMKFIFETIASYHPHYVGREFNSPTTQSSVYRDSDVVFQRKSLENGLVSYVVVTESSILCACMIGHIFHELSYQDKSQLDSRLLCSVKGHSGGKKYLCQQSVGNLINMKYCYTRDAFRPGKYWREKTLSRETHMLSTVA